METPGYATELPVTIEASDHQMILCGFQKTDKGQVLRNNVDTAGVICLGTGVFFILITSLFQVTLFCTREHQRDMCTYVWWCKRIKYNKKRNENIKNTTGVETYVLEKKTVQKRQLM